MNMLEEQTIDSMELYFMGREELLDPGVLQEGVWQKGLNRY